MLHTENFKKKMYWEDDKAVDLVASALERGLVVGSSDTIPGLLAPLTEAGFEALNAIKRRSDKPYLILIGRFDSLNDFLVSEQGVFGQIEKLKKAFWPGPLTLILKAKDKIPAFLASKDGNIAIRMPNHVYLQSLLKKFPGLFSTSANFSGEPVPEFVDQISKEMVDHVELVVKDRVEKGGILPSTIVDCTGDEIKVVREGAIPAKLIFDVLKR
ncbi:MAG: Translation factor SUA5 [candidate division TM6 bacterium GW2011_GWF2_32_72]|nr:MAG: Translation factor SUA5 [candidate division TM6 bacterium GW2011_GWF2_32_72]